MSETTILKEKEIDSITRIIDLMEKWNLVLPELFSLKLLININNIKTVNHINCHKAVDKILNSDMKKETLEKILKEYFWCD